MCPSEVVATIVKPEKYRGSIALTVNHENRKTKYACESIFQQPARLYACFLRMRNHSLVNPTTGQFTRIPVVLTGPPPGLTNKPALLLTVTSSPSVISFR